MEGDGNDKLAALEARLKGLADRVRGELPARAAEMRAALGALETDEAAARADLTRLAHKLRGTAGSHGIEGLTEPAAQIEAGARTMDLATLRREVSALADRVEAAGRGAAPAAPRAAAAPAASALVKQLAGRSVLAIDDDEPTRRLLGMTLGNLGGASARVESSASAFFSALEAQRFDVVVVDAMMPEVNGLACLERIAGSALAHDGVLYFVLSAATPEELGWSLPSSLRVAWLRKPFRPRELLDAIAAHLAG